MNTAMIPASADDALEMLESVMGFLAALDPADLPEAQVSRTLRVLERADAVEAAVRGRFLHAFDAQEGPVGDGQRNIRAWLVHSLRVTRGQAAEYQALQALARDHHVLHAALAEGHVITKSEALQVARWTRAIAEQYREDAEKILVTAARDGAGLRTLATLCAELRARTAEPDPDGRDPGLDRGVSLHTTLDGAGVIHGDLTPECAAMVQAVLDALSAPAGAGDLRTRPERYHDALSEAMKRLLASDLLPQRAGQPVKALVHISFADLCQLDADSGVQDQWIAEYRARWAAHRAANSVATGDGGAWLEGAAARKVACDAMIIPVVTADLDPAAVDDLIDLGVQNNHLRTRPQPAAPHAEHAAVADALAELERQVLGKILQVVSGPGGAALFLRRHLLGKPLAGPSLPLDVGQTDEIPRHLRRLVALRDQTCQFPGGCDQPASGCEPHHVTHRHDGGHTSLTNLKDYCWWHHHVVLHELGWTLTAHPDGTSPAPSPDGKIIRSHSPPPHPG